MTQLERTTSTARVGQRDLLDVALEELDVRRRRPWRALRAGEVEHLVGHVEAVGRAGRADAAGGEQHVDPAAGAEVEHGLALVEVGDRGRVRRSPATRAPRRRAAVALASS